MTLKKEIDEIIALEKAFDVEKLSIDGVYVWPLIRMLLMGSWVQDKFRIENRRKPAHTIIYLRFISFFCVVKRNMKRVRHLGSAIYRYRRIQTLAKYDVGVWAHDVDRVRVGNVDYSVFGDALRDLQAPGGASVVCVDHYITSKPRRASGPYFDATLLGYFAKIKMRLRCLTSKHQKTEMHGPALKDIITWCRLRNLTVHELTERRIVAYFIYIRALKNSYIKIILHSQMKLCMKACWYGAEGMALAWAAKEVGIPCYDIQHGLAGGNAHRAYCGWTKFPKYGYLMMPDGFWCWTLRDKEAIESWGYRQSPAVHSLVGGNVWNRVWIEKKIPIADHMLTAGFLESDNQNSQIKILFTMQAIGIPDLIQALIDRSPRHWVWWIRCHPTQSDSMSNLLEIFSKNKNVYISEPSSMPLPLLLREADAHLSGWSAVALDALQYGLKSILFHPAAKEYFAKQISDRNVYASSDIDVIFGLIEKNKNRFSAKQDLCNTPSLRDLMVR